MQIATADDVKQLGAILSVWAHPDDETFVAGGILATAAQNGQQVICITATRGEQGVQDESRWPAAQLANIREKELEASLRKLGVTKHKWLTYKDGECATVDQNKAIAVVANLIEKYKPDTIITFGSEGLTGHSDHRAVSRWIDAAVARLEKKPRVLHPVYDSAQFEQFLVPLHKRINVFFNIDKPPLKAKADCAVALTLSPKIFEQKIQALIVQPSQMERVLKALSPDQCKGVFGVEYFVAASPLEYNK